MEGEQAGVPGGGQKKRWREEDVDEGRTMLSEYPETVHNMQLNLIVDQASVKRDEQVPVS